MASIASLWYGRRVMVMLFVNLFDFYQVRVPFEDFVLGLKITPGVFFVCITGDLHPYLVVFAKCSAPILEKMAIFLVTKNPLD